VISTLRTALVVLTGVVLLAGCSDGPIAGDRGASSPLRFAIADGARGGQPEFFWLTPTVADAPTATGAFDPGALSELAIEVCLLSEAGVCVGPVLERFTSESRPTPTRLRVDATRGFYEATWLTGASGAKAGDTYRVSVLRAGATLGFVDVQMVQNTPALASVDTRRFTGLVKGQQFTVRFRLELPVARNYVRVNEVESNQGAPGDWIELHNTSARPLELSGYVVRDNDGARGYVFPAGATIPGGGFLVIEEAQLGFGLGAGDQARLFAPDGSLVDGYTWTAHAATTYGRCPDGTGAFVTTSLVTKGAANDCAPIVRLNEIESSGGTPGDWVELYNPNLQAVSLAGHVLRDATDAGGYVFPAGATIAPNGHLVVERTQLGFELDAADAVRLFRPNGTSLVDAFVWTADAATTYGRCPDGVGALIVTTSPTKGTANDCVVATTVVKINEVESNGGTPGDWVELRNTSAAPVDLSGYVFKDNDDTHAYVLPAGSVIAAGGYLVLDELVNGVGGFDFGLGANEQARLYAPGGAVLVDQYAWTAHAPTTYGRCPDGTGAFVTMTSSTRGAANDCGVAVRLNEIESSGGAPGDWVELYNAGPVAVDLGGYVFRDNNDAAGYVIPTGTSIARVATWCSTSW
jgi:hypothetical protein